MLEEALAGRILAEPVGEAGHGVEPAPVDGEGAHPMESRGLPVDGAGGRPGSAPDELILANLVRGEGIVKLRPTAVLDAQHGGFTAGSSPVSWGSIDELFVNLTIPK